MRDARERMLGARGAISAPHCPVIPELDVFRISLCRRTLLVEQTECGRALTRFACGPDRVYTWGWLLAVALANLAQGIEMTAPARDLQSLIRHADVAYRLAVRVTGSEEGAEDIVQQAYLAAVRAFRSDAPPARPRAWFLGAVTNLARRELRNRGIRRRKEADMKPAISSCPAAPAPEAGLIGALREALAGLEEKYRLPVTLCHEEGFSQRETAAVLGVPERTISKYVKVGLERLRGTLERVGYPAAAAAVLGGLKQTAPAAPASLAGRVEALVSSGAKATPRKLALRAARKAAAAKGGFAMKMLAGVVLAGAVAVGVAMVVPGEESGPEPLPAEKPAAEPAGDVPRMVLDESASRWVVDRFAGNSTAGPQFFQGPARHVGGLGRPRVATTPDGKVFLATKEHLLRISPDGALRLLAGGGSNRGDCAGRDAAIQAESMVYSPADGGLYFVHRMIPCVRRLFKKDGAWRVEVVAGSPTEVGDADGAGRIARFKEPRSVAATSKGTIYLLDGTRHLRKIEKGRVSTVAKFKGGKDLVDGPLAGATLAITKMTGMICLGENDETLYVADHWNRAVRRIDLKARTITTVAGMPNPNKKRSETRFDHQSDGPALTHASFASGSAFVCWDPVHKALWCGGPDTSRLRWLRNGEVRTVLTCKGKGDWSQNALGLSGDKVKMQYVQVRAMDSEGRAYIITGTSKTGVWRAYEKGGAR